MSDSGGDPTSLVIHGERVEQGCRRRVEIPVARLPSGHFLSLPIELLNGAGPGPTVWLSGAIHGDEIVGVEIIRKVLDSLEPDRIRGAVVAAPVVNVFGFVFESRYLPDRRDLNRSFPGTKRGSLAGRLARFFMDEVVSRCDLGIDFHAGSNDRTNLPQIRGNMDDAETRRLAVAFAPPVIVHAKPVRGSLRAAAIRRGKRVLLFEGGEPRRFSPQAVEVGVQGTLRTLDALGMLDFTPDLAEAESLESRSTKWIRAPRGGIMRLETVLGARVRKGERIGVITDPLAESGEEVKTRTDGIVIGHTVNPLVSLGDALVHVAEVMRSSG